MSKRAEEAALKAYPPETKKAIELLPRDWNKPKRTAFIQGYEQAEKDYTEYAQLWVDSGDANVKSFHRFLKDRGFID